MFCVVKSGIFVNDVKQTTIALRDKDDIPFFEVKESSEEFDSYLLTGNIKDYPQDAYIVTPKEFFSIIEILERFLKNDFEYEKNVKEIIATNLDLPKYSSGDELLNDIFTDINTKEINIHYFEEEL